MTQANRLKPIRSTRPAVTADLMKRTGLDEARLTELVHCFYAKIRADAVLGPIFAERVPEWAPHLERMVVFWSSVALMTGQYHGTPVPKHSSLPVTKGDFERWLTLFAEAARETCAPMGADHVIERAERIARALHIAVEEAQSAPGAVPILR